MKTGLWCQIGSIHPRRHYACTGQKWRERKKGKICQNDTNGKTWTDVCKKKTRKKTRKHWLRFQPARQTRLQHQLHCWSLKWLGKFITEVPGSYKKQTKNKPLLELFDCRTIDENICWDRKTFHKAEKEELVKDAADLLDAVKKRSWCLMMGWRLTSAIKRVLWQN